jgi:hypothetical protein
MSAALFAVPFSIDVFLPPHYQHILAELLKAGKAHAHIAIMHEALWRMRGSAMTFEERRAELEADMIATRRCAARWLNAWR